MGVLDLDDTKVSKKTYETIFNTYVEEIQKMYDDADCERYVRWNKMIPHLSEDSELDDWGKIMPKSHRKLSLQCEAYAKQLAECRDEISTLKAALHTTGQKYGTLLYLSGYLKHMLEKCNPKCKNGLTSLINVTLDKEDAKKVIQYSKK